MASSFLTKLLSGIKNFLMNMASPLAGFNIDDAKMNVKDGEYYILYQFGTEQSVKDETGEDITNVKGEKIPLNLLLSTVNTKEALAPLLKGLNEMGTLKDSNPKEFNALMYLMLGDEKYKTPESEPEKEQKMASVYDENDKWVENIDLNTEDGQAKEADYKSKGYKIWSSTKISKQSIMAESDNAEYLAAKNAGKGLLGVNLETNGALPDDSISFGGRQWSWEKIAADYLKYALECEVPGKDYGAISGVSLSQCAKLIPEYLITKTNTIANASEVNVDLAGLVKPILSRLQADLAEYFTDAYNKGIEKKTTAQKEAEKAQQQETDNTNSEESDNSQGDDTDMNTEDTTQSGTNTLTSRQISVKLKKITASDELQLLGLQSNYNPTDTLDDLEEAIYQDEFMDILTEDPQTFAITVDDDGYDIEQCEDCINDPCASLCEVFKSGIRAYRNLYILHWMSHGNDMMKLHNLSEEMYDELQSEIDTIGELLVEKQGTVPQLDFPCDYIPIQQYDFQTGLDQIKSLISMYIDCIDYAYPNQTSDVQSTLDEWLRYWNKQLNYFVKGQEM